MKRILPNARIQPRLEKKRTMSAFVRVSRLFSRPACFLLVFGSLLASACLDDFEDAATLEMVEDLHLAEYPESEEDGFHSPDMAVGLKEESATDTTSAAAGISQCPIGWYDGANCRMGTAPPGSSGFVYNGQLYYHAVVEQSCPEPGSWWDGAHCHLPSIPAGTNPFIWNGHPYYTYAPGGVRCPVAGSWDDGANCRVSHPANSKAFVWSGQLYYWIPSCPVSGSWWNGAHCRMPNIPPGTSAFIYLNIHLYYTPPQLFPTVGRMVVKVADVWGSPRQNVLVHVGGASGWTNSQGKVCLNSPVNTGVSVTAGPVAKTCQTSNLTCSSNSNCYISY